MEVIATPSSPPTSDFDFNTARSTGYVLSAPSTPKRFGELYYFSGDHLDDTALHEFSQDLEKSSLSTEELFHGGRIKPQSQTLGRRSSRKEEDEKFSGQRGRERVTSLSGSGRRSCRLYRSLSPLRVSERLWEEEQEEENSKHVASETLTPAATQSSSSSTKISSSGSKKWRLKDFLLFRSASEGRASDKDPFRKYLKKKEEGSLTRRRSGPVSAHELHYTMNKAVSNDMKKKSFLPYKQGILGRLAFNPAANALANGFGSFYR